MATDVTVRPEELSFLGGGHSGGWRGGVVVGLSRFTIIRERSVSVRRSRLSTYL